MEFGLEQKWALGVVVTLVILETLVPRIRTRIFSREARENVFWLVFNKTISLLGVGSFIYLASSSGGSFIPFRVDFTSYHPVLQFFIFLMFCDLVSYAGHRLLHSNSFLWRFHQLHHSSKELTTLSSFRHHWIEDVYYGVFFGLSSSCLLLNNDIKISVFIIMGLVCYFQHSNLKIRFNAILNYVVITPLNHRWHHSTEVIKHKGQNFGFVFTIWDRLFGSYYVPDEEPHELGIKGEYPKGIAARIVYPFYKT